MTTDTYNDDGEILQNNDKGPGWFLKIAYVVITAFCIYYAVTYWNWQSSYQEQQSQIQQKIGGK
jgi:hypothetical protein